jgi:hypothetical protein
VSTPRDILIAAASAVVSAAVTVGITSGAPLFLRAYKNRRHEPKKAHRKFCLDQAQWFYDRAEKLRVLRAQLAFEPPRDRFQLSLYLSKLDHDDQQWTMKITDLHVLANAASDKAEECDENGREAERNAEEVDSKIYW